MQNPVKMPFIVAEICTSHLGDYKRAIALIEAAKESGADAVKFQTYTPREIAADVMIESGPWAGRSYHDLYAEGSMPWAWHETLFGHARHIGLVPFSSPFSEAAVARLETVYCPVYKIASPEITHLALIAAAARTGKPLFISTGMASSKEIYMARYTAAKNGCNDITLLHCISAYPAHAEDFNLNTLARMKKCGYKVGLSDHSLGHVAAAAAVALGAEVIEKHFTLSRADGGLDAGHSLEPYEFMAMADACRQTAMAMGENRFGAFDSEKDSYQYRRSIWITKDIKAGEQLTSANMAVLRPNYGLEPDMWDRIIGKRVNCDLKANTPMSLNYVGL